MDKSKWEHPNLKIFRQFGFQPKSNSGDTQVTGRCTFCGANHFFVNIERKAWDCKSCGRSGGYQKFLQQVVKFDGDNFTKDSAAELVAKRGISLDTFRQFHVGYHPLTDCYTIPVWDENKADIFNIRIYRPDGVLMNCAGSKVALYGWWNAKKKYTDIWLCEGEWDSLAMYDILRKSGLTETELTTHIILGAPGANTFKAEWASLFSGKRVHVLYDNDYDRVDDKGVFHPSPGKSGMWKVYDIIHTITKQIDFIHWPRLYKDGFDINDLLRLKRGNIPRAMKQITTMLQSKPPEIDYPEGYDGKRKEAEPEKPKHVGGGLTPDDVYQRYRKWLKMDSVEPLEVMFGTALANRLPGDPLWVLIIGASSGMKSELIMSLDDVPDIFAISSLTPHTLISGSSTSGGGDPSLIPRLDGKLLTIKDMTVILDMAEQARDAIISQLRDAYDGKCAKPFGTGAMRAYESKFGIIAGATDAIEQFLEGGSAMGERFIGYHLPEDKSYVASREIMIKALGNILDRNKDDMRNELKDIATQVLDHDFGTMPILSPEILEMLMPLAYWVATMRGTVTRDKYTREITRRAYIERPTRISIQFTKLLLGIAQFKRHDKALIDDYKTIRSIAMSTVPSHLEQLVRTIKNEDIDGVYTAQDFSDIMRLPIETVRRFAENLYQLGVFRVKKISSIVQQWYVADDFKSIINQAGLYHKL